MYMLFLNDLVQPKKNQISNLIPCVLIISIFFLTFFVSLFFNRRLINRAPTNRSAIFCGTEPRWLTRTKRFPRPSFWSTGSSQSSERRSLWRRGSESSDEKVCRSQESYWPDRETRSLSSFQELIGAFNFLDLIQMND